MTKIIKEQYGFTLIELMVVITVLAVLAGIVLINVNPLGQRKKENDVKRKADVAKIQSMLERYKSDVGQYPDSIPCANILANPNGDITYGTIPCDPNNDGTNYFYTIYTLNSQNVAYCLRACFVNITDTARDENNVGYGKTNNPTPAQMGSNCAAVPDCASGSRSYTVLNP